MLLAGETLPQLKRTTCRNASMSWEVSPAPKGPVVKAMRRVFKFVETDDDPSILSCLDEAPDPPPKKGWSAGEANCSYSREGTVLSFTYDFPI